MPKITLRLLKWWTSINYPGGFYENFVAMVTNKKEANEIGQHYTSMLKGICGPFNEHVWAEYHDDKFAILRYDILPNKIVHPTMIEKWGGKDKDDVYHVPTYKKVCGTTQKQNKNDVCYSDGFEWVPIK